MTIIDLQQTALAHWSALRERSWLYWLREFCAAFVGLFVLDVSWRFMDLMIDFICDHIHWLKFLSDN